MRRTATLFRLTRLAGLILLYPDLHAFADGGRQVSGAEDRAAVGVASPLPALTVHLVRPDRQLARLLDLFEGTRAPHPAAALSAWKRANRDSRGLGKAREAAIAMLNPEMVQEWRTLDRADLIIAFDSGDGHARWYTILPRDDGTFAALATA